MNFKERKDMDFYLCSFLFHASFLSCHKLIIIRLSLVYIYMSYVLYTCYFFFSFFFFFFYYYYLNCEGSIVYICNTLQDMKVLIIKKNTLSYSFISNHGFYSHPSSYGILRSHCIRRQLCKSPPFSLLTSLEPPPHVSIVVIVSYACWTSL